MKRIASFLFAVTLAAFSAQAEWTITSTSGSTRVITDGNWTLNLCNNYNNGDSVAYSSNAGNSTELDLTGVYADTGRTITRIDNQGFRDKKDITKIILPDSCKVMWNNAFQGCTALETVGIPSTFTTFNSGNMFDGCSALKTIYFTDETPEIGTVHLPEAITDIKGLMFSGCSSIEKVIAPGVVSIGDRAFYNCSSLTTVEISPSLSTMTSSQNFRGCSALTTVYPAGTTPVVGTVLLPDTLTVIPGWGAFFGCANIEKVVARGVVDVGNQTFAGMTSLEQVVLSPNLEWLRTDGTTWNKSAFYNGTADAKLVDFYPTVFPAGFHMVDPSNSKACEGMFAYTQITNYFDFSACTFTEIPPHAFRNTQLAGATLPATLATIGQQAFWCLCNSATFRFLGDQPTVTKTDNNAPFRNWNAAHNNHSANQIGFRHTFVVDADTYPAWTNDTKFISMADVANNNTLKTLYTRESSDFPTPDYPEETLGVTSWGDNGAYAWLVQYVDHSTVTATWMNGTDVYASTAVELNAAPVAPATNPAKESTAELEYTFVGWNTDPNATTALDLATLALNKATTFYAIYSSATRSYEITWKRDAETVLDTTTVLYGVVPTHADASKDADETHSYRFDGWSTDGETVLETLPAVTGAATYIAVFTPLSLDTSVTVFWFDEDGTTPLDPATTTVEKGAKPTHAEPTKAATVDTAYTFEGWTQVGGDGTVVYTTADLPAASADVSYKAVYSSATRKYTITFMDYDGTTILKTAEIEYNSAATVVEAAKPADPVRAATAEYTYAFSGWTPAFADVTGDATYTAQYTATPNEYTATFVDEDGTTVLKEEATYAYGAPVVKPDDPTKEGYTFAGWTVGGAVVDVTTMPAANTVYAATYTKNTYTITWKNANGATLGTTTVEHGETPAYGGTAPSLSNTSKLGYTFTGWTPEIVAATEATTYTAAYKVAFLSPMTIALDSAAYDRSQCEATVVTEVGNTNATATTTAEATAQFKTTSVTGEATVDGTTVTSVFDNFASGRGYEWTITATQTYGAEYSGASESASIKGRTYARAAKSWFDNAAVKWNEGAFAPTAQSGSGAQVRLRATVTFPAALPRALPEAGSAVVGITAYQPNAGVAPRYYAWNGSQWVKLVGVAPKGGFAVNLLGVVDFARKDGPAVAWYADGFQLTTEKGDWEVPLAGGAKLTSFGLVGDLSVGSLSGDYDIGGQGFTLLVR